MSTRPDTHQPFEGMATIVPVSNVAATIEFYVETLGFEKREQSPDGSYGLVARGPVGVMLLRCADDAALKATAENISMYIWVSGLEAVYAGYKPKLDKLEPGRVRAPFDQPYGMREFHVKDPDGCLLMFGEDQIDSRNSQ